MTVGLVFPDNADFKARLTRAMAEKGEAWERGYRSALAIPSAVYLKREAR